MKKYALGLHEKAMPLFLTYTEKFKTARDCGFDYIELSIDETDEKLARLEYSSVEKKKILDSMFETNMFFRSMCLSAHRKYPLGSLDEKIRERSLDIIKKAVDFSYVLGIRVIQLPGCDVYYETGNKKTEQFFVENLQEAVNFAASAGIMLGFEALETNTVKKTMRYVRKINSPYLGVYPDFGNSMNAMHNYNTKVFDDLETGQGHIVAMHVKETVSGKFREISFGNEHDHFVSGIKKAYELGVRCFVAKMLHSEKELWQDDIKQANELLREIFAVL